MIRDPKNKFVFLVQQEAPEMDLFCMPLPMLPSSGILLSFAEMGTDRRQLQTAAPGQQPVPGQPCGQERGPERGSVQRCPVPAVEVLTQPAAVGVAAARPHRQAESGDHIIDYVS